MSEAKSAEKSATATLHPVLKGTVYFDKLGKATGFSFEPVNCAESVKLDATMAAMILGRAMARGEFKLPGMTFPAEAK